MHTNSSSKGVRGRGSIMKRATLTNIKRVSGCSCNRCTSTGLLILWVEANRKNIDERCLCCCCTVEKRSGSSAPTEVLQSLFCSKTSTERVRLNPTQRRTLDQTALKKNVLAVFNFSGGGHAVAIKFPFSNYDIVQLASCLLPWRDDASFFLTEKRSDQNKNLFLWLRLFLLSHPVYSYLPLRFFVNTFCCSR